MDLSFYRLLLINNNIFIFSIFKRRKRKRSRPSGSGSGPVPTTVGTVVQLASPTTISANLQQRLARVSEQFGSVSGGVVIKEEDDDEEDEEEEELAVNHSGMWSFREF